MTYLIGFIKSLGSVGMFANGGRLSGFGRYVNFDAYPYEQTTKEIRARLVHAYAVLPLPILPRPTPYP